MKTEMTLVRRIPHIYVMIILIILFILFVSGCGTTSDHLQKPISQAETEIENTVSVFLSQQKNIIPIESCEAYDVFIKNKNYQFALYEPDNACYLGANIINDNANAKIETFETTVGREHALYANTMVLGEEYPYNWILECVSSMKTPVLTIHPPNHYNPFRYDHLYSAAKAAGELNIPMFVEFYPYSARLGYDKDEYIRYFQKAYNLFDTYAPNVSFVWGTSLDDIYDCSNYYPGDDYTDWVSVNIKMDISQKNDDLAQDNLYKDSLYGLDYFYYQFQKTKPILISGLSISHYSTENMNYYTAEAADQISKIYHSVIENYPSIKAIIYNSYNAIDQKEGTQGVKQYYNNYLISDEMSILEAYQKSIDNEYFLCWVITKDDREGGSESVGALIRSPFSAYASKGEYYIPERLLQYDLSLVGLSTLASEAIYIDGEKFFSIETLNYKLQTQFKANDQKKRIVL